KNNPIKNANKASFQQDLDSFKSDLDLTHSQKIAGTVGEYDISGENVNVGDEVEMKKMIPSISSKYAKILGIEQGKLVVSKSVSKEQLEWSKEIQVNPEIFVVGKDGANIPVFPTANGKPNTDVKAVKWNGVVEQTYTTMPTDEWYKYEAQSTTTQNGGTSKWANMQTKDGSYFVWIPRYAYKITSGWHTSTAGTIDVKLMKGASDTECSDGSKLPSDYKIHDAFTFDGKSVPGIWVAKYEASNSFDKVKVVPNVTSWRNITHKNIFDKCISMQTDKETYGWEINNAHMMKSNEWGCVAYFTHSQYGRNGTEVTINNNSAYITGIAGDSISAIENTSTTNSYNTDKGKLASTTGNIYGIYDMSGGAWEYISGNLKGYPGMYSWTNELIDANAKYFNMYIPSENPENLKDNYEANKDLSVARGDAICDTSSSGDDNTSWFEDYSYFLDSKASLSLYGGSYASRISAGMFTFGNRNGESSTYFSFRPVIF
ncbi:MAG: hypothetical protein RSE00_05490, partial [Clostridia bacterium]